MERTALRLATCAALLNGGSGPWPTIAEKYVYDSMQDNLVDVVPNRRRPVIVVRTDEDNHTYRSHTEATRQVRLLIEIGTLTTVTVKLANGKEELKEDWPRTDASLEAFLDMLEWQVNQALFGWTDWAIWWKNLNYGILFGHQSVPRFSPPERGSVRLAVRTLVFQMSLPPECIVLPVKEYAPTPQYVLPQKWCKIVNYILEHGGGDFKTAVEQQIRTVFKYGQVRQPAFPPLQRVWATLPQYEVEAEWPIEQVAPFIGEDVPLTPPDLGEPPDIAVPP